MGILINRFDGGLVDFMSARDLSAKQFQRLENMRINRVSRLVKRPGEAARTAESATALQVLPGMGHIQYRAERDESNVHVNSHFRTISLVDISGTPVVSIRRNNSINDDTGTFTEFLGSTVWTLRQVVGSSNISFSGNEITKASGLDVFFPGDLLRVYGSGEDNDGYVHVISATATTITVVEDLTTASNTSAVLIAFPHVSMYAINGVLRISDGNFHDTAPSQSYGHIKRDFWGQGITYGSNGGRFEQPVMSEAYNSYLLKAQELVAPTIIAGARTGQATELITNGDFSSGDPPDDWDAVRATLATDAGRLKVTATSDYGYGKQDIVTVSGKKYSLRFDYENTAGDVAQYQVYDVTNAVDIIARTDLADQTGSEISSGQIGFTATGISTKIILIAKNDTDIVWFDDVGVHQIGCVAIHIAGAHHEFKELMPNSIDRTFAGGGTAWANVDLNAFDETTDLTITASAADQYCTCPVASMPMTAGRKYKLQFDVANLISTFTIQDFTGYRDLGLSGRMVKSSQ